MAGFRVMGPTWGPSGADRTQVGPMLAPWILLSGCICGTRGDELISPTTKIITLVFYVGNLRSSDLHIRVLMCILLVLSRCELRHAALGTEIHSHDDVIKWKHFPRYWPFVRGIHQPPVNSPHKGQWREALMLSLICVGINDWLKNREAGDLRRYRGHYDVTVMT